MSDLRAIAIKYSDKLKKIKVFLSDVDGILTDGSVYWSGEEVGFNRSFNVLDGYGMKVLQKAGLKVGVISGGDSLGLQRRCKYLGFDFNFLGNEDKRDAYLKVLQETGVQDEEILYLGDEFFDIPLLKRAGFSATSNMASLEVQEICDYVATRSPGKGLVREVVDLVRYAQDIVPLIASF